MEQFEKTMVSMQVGTVPFPVVFIASMRIQIVQIVRYRCLIIKTIVLYAKSLPHAE